MKPAKQRATLLICAASTALLLCAVPSTAWTQSPQPVCDRGIGHFDTRFSTGVTVHVGAVPSGGFATRACEATLRWRDGQTIVVSSAAQLDIDVLGADLGLGVPVAAFVVRPAQDDWREIYQIWSLEKKPRLLRTLTGAASYRAADAAFNQQTAIWTTDPAALEGFDGLTVTDFASPPVAALRFERGHLVDVSAWYPAQYDRQIASLRIQLTLAALVQFRNSDGQLKSRAVPQSEQIALRKTKATVLEIVCAFLYSGRPVQAWAELESAWPIGDLPRAKAALLAARSRGIDAQVEQVAAATLSPKWTVEPLVYEYLKPAAAQAQTGGQLMYGAPGTAGSGPVLDKGLAPPTDLYEADAEPQPISLWRPPPSQPDQPLFHEQETLLLTIDNAGKVHSVTTQTPGGDPELLQAAMNWKFIPAMVDGKPVAYRLKLDVRLLR